MAKETKEEGFHSGAELPVSLFVAEQWEIGVKIDDIEFPYFAWESFEEQTEIDEEIEKADLIIRKIIDSKGEK